MSLSAVGLQNHAPANAAGITLLTVEHVHARRRGQDLVLVPLDDERRMLAFTMAQTYGELARAFVGKDRQSFMAACKALTPSWGARDRKLADALLKLVLDRCVFEEETQLDSPAVRALVFERAACLRRTALAPEAFDRSAILAEAAQVLAQPPAAVEAALYGDLPGAHILKEAAVPPPQTVVELYDVAQTQAVLLRATKVVVTVSARDPMQFRVLFAKLKFHQLLFAIVPAAAGGYQITLDGPFSMFDAVTRYGLKLAMALPAIMSCDTWSLTADILWGANRQPMRFRQKGLAQASSNMAADPIEPIAVLVERWPALQCTWQIAQSTRILDLPGVGLCVPDLEFTRPHDSRPIYFELLGHWSREAVWKRVELAEAGLPFDVVFGVSKNLRVSEAVLSDETSAALYVFAKVPNARSLLERIERVVSRRNN